MDKGRIEQIGSPEDVYERPATAFVHEFIGDPIVVPVNVVDGTVHFAGRRTSLQALGTPSGDAHLFVRPYETIVVASATRRSAERLGEFTALAPHAESRSLWKALPASSKSMRHAQTARSW
jgi:ABC-type sulfate/molybdate transport systems ATPase subunit